MVQVPARDGRPVRTVLLTGASTGLGLAIARLLIAGGDRVMLTARRESLDRFAAAGIDESTRVWLRPLDVTNAVERRTVVEEARDRWGGVDVLINNAGVSYRAVVEHVDNVAGNAQMQVNYHAPMELARLVLPGMRAKRSGRIINVSSVSGMMAMPTMAVYSASKFALEGASEALWYEVRPWDVRVTLIQPGFINSRSFHGVRMTTESADSDQTEAEPYHEHYHHMAPFIEKMMGRSWATPERVARTIVKTMNRRRPPLRVSATFDARLFFALRRLLPRWLYHWLLYRSLPGVRTWGPNRPQLGAPARPRLEPPRTDDEG